MDISSSIFRWVRVVVVAVLILGGAYWGLNGYVATSGPSANALAVAASAALASLFILGAIGILVVNGISTMNEHLEHLSTAADEHNKLLRYLAKQNQPLK